MHHAVLGWAGVSFAGLATAATSGPDYAGIALVISAIAGLLSAVTAMVIALRRKPGAGDEQTVALLQQIAENLKPEDKP